MQKPKGTQDFLPGTVEIWQYIENKARDVCQRFRYSEVRTPIFEHTELFERGVGETTDVVQKEMYSFLDRGERSITLRPEGTAGVVRAFIENKLYADPDTTKLYYIGPMFRYERPQAGRYRQFHQFGVEAFGSNDPNLDAEIIALGYLFYKELGLKDVSLDLNTVATPAVRAAFKEKLQDYLRPKLDTLCEDCRTRFDKNPLRVLDCKIDQDKFEDAPSLLDNLDEECESHFRAVRSRLDDMGIPYRINPRLVRGLDYYTHTAFEFKAAGIGSIDTIGGGGRYNGLVSEFSDQDQPGIGFGLGMERLVLILQHQGIEAASEQELDLYFITLGAAAEREASKLVYRLREAGLAVDQDYQGRKMKGQMKAADRFHAKYVAILGDDELERGEISFKTMATGEQETIRLDTLIDHTVKRIQS